MANPTTSPIEHRHGCGCVAKIHDDLVEFEACADPAHVRGISGWRQAAERGGVAFCWVSPTAERVGVRLPCGCWWEIVDRELHVFPCRLPGHEQILEEICRVFAKAEDIQLRAVGPREEDR